MAVKIQRSFSGGEISPFVLPLTGIKRRTHGLLKAKNTIVKKFGTLENRTGTELINHPRAPNRGFVPRLVPFFDSSGDAHLISFNGNIISFFSEENGVFGVTRDVITTDWTPEIVKRLNFSQQGDSLVITSYFITPRVLVRGLGGWRLDDLDVRRREFPGSVPSVTATSFTTDVSVSIPNIFIAVTAVYKGEETAAVFNGITPNVEQSQRIRLDLKNPITIGFDHGDEPEPDQYRIYLGTAGIYHLLAIAKGDQTSFKYIGEPTDPTQTLVSDDDLLNIPEYDVRAGIEIQTNGQGGIFQATEDSTTREMLVQIRDSSPLFIATGGSPYLSEDGSIDRIVVFGTQIGASPAYGFYDLFTREPVRVPSGDDTDGRPLDPVFLRAANRNPNVSTFFGQRLVLASTQGGPGEIFVSALGTFRDFQRSEILSDASAYSFEIATRKSNLVKYIAGLRQPIVFTGQSEWGLGEDLSATGVNPSPQSEYGIGDLPPLATENSILFLEGLNKLRDYGYDFQTGGYHGNDLTTFSSHLFEGRKVVSMAFEKDPDPVVWVVLDDGAVRSLTYFKEQSIFAWCRHDFGGEVKQVEVLQKTGESEVYFLIDRDGRINIERLSRVNRRDNRTWTFLDSHKKIDLRNTDESLIVYIYSGTTWDEADEGLEMQVPPSLTPLLNPGDYFDVFHGDIKVRCEIVGLKEPDNPSLHVFKVLVDREIPEAIRGGTFGNQITNWARTTKTFTGLGHLVGKEVGAFADGSVIANPHSGTGLTVSAGGTVDLGGHYSVVCVGLPYVSDVETLDIDVTGSDTVVDERMTVNEVSLYVHNTRGLYYGAKAPPTDTSVQGLYPQKTQVGRELEIAMLNGLVSKIVSSKWAEGGRMFLRQIDPLPFACQSIIIDGDLAGYRSNRRSEV